VNRHVARLKRLFRHLPREIPTGEPPGYGTEERLTWFLRTTPRPWTQAVFDRVWAEWGDRHETADSVNAGQARAPGIGTDGYISSVPVVEPSKS